MCNLFENKTSFADLVHAFGAIRMPLRRPEPQAAPNLPALDAVRPTDLAPVVRPYADGVELVQMAWGFRPAKPKAGPVTNFRSEGRRFASSEDRGRCLIPATAFFEFTGDRSPKTRWRFTETGQPWFCLAGLWRRDDGGPDRFTLLTVAPGPDMAPYHDRQVVLPPRDAWAAWLSGAPEETLLRPSLAGGLTVRRDTAERQPSLFGTEP